MSDLCDKLGCNCLGTKFCGGCGKASYCSADCQKEDWKVHKLSCIDVKRLPSTFASLSQLNKYIEKIFARVEFLKSKGKVEDAVTIMKEFLVFNEQQLGEEIEGTKYFMRSNGDQIDNLNLIGIRMEISRMDNRSNDSVSRLAFLTETRRMLEFHDRSEDQILIALSDAERHLAPISYSNEICVEAAHHCAQSLMFARLIKGEARIFTEYTTLKHFSGIRAYQGRRLEAIDFAEEAYILVSGTYDPVHHLVQDASNFLVDRLISNNDYLRADDYCRISYENLIDPRNAIDQKGDLVIRTMMQLAEIWLQKGPIEDEAAAFAFAEEAEELSRKAYLIVDGKEFSESLQVVRSCNAFAEVLMKRGKYTDETRVVLEHLLALMRLQEYRPDSKLRHSLRPLAYSDHVGESVPPGDVRDRVLQLRDEYEKEMKLFSM